VELPEFKEIGLGETPIGHKYGVEVVRGRKEVLTLLRQVSVVL
jgi:hypothetical protein